MHIFYGRHCLFRGGQYFNDELMGKLSLVDNADLPVVLRIGPYCTIMFFINFHGGKEVQGRVDG
jgi:hypothetical protein